MQWAYKFEYSKENFKKEVENKWEIASYFRGLQTVEKKNLRNLL